MPTAESNRGCLDHVQTSQPLGYYSFRNDVCILKLSFLRIVCIEPCTPIRQFVDEGCRIEAESYEVRSNLLAECSSLKLVAIMNFRLYTHW